KKNRKRHGRKGARYWVLSALSTGAIIAVTIGSSHRMVVGYAEERNGRLEMVSMNEDKVSTIDFNIAAGQLGEVLEAFQKRSGLTVNVDNESIRGIQSPGVVGNYTPEAALKLILNGTGVSYAFRDARSVLLSLKAEDASVEIRDDSVRLVSSPKHTEPLRDTPQTINVIPKEVIEQQGAMTLRDVLQNVPGITLTAGEGGTAAGDNLTVRGFSARNDIYIDGVRDLGAQSRDAFNLEQVEVVKGPSSTYTGRGSTGGTVNLVSKSPTVRRSFAGSLIGGTDKTKRATGDVNLPLGDSVALRVNGLFHGSEFPGRSDVDFRRLGFAPSIMFGLGSRTRYTLSYFYMDQDNVSDYGIPWVPVTDANRANVLRDYIDRPAPVSRDTFYGFIDRDREKLRSDQVTFRFEHDFDDNLSLRNQFRYGYSRRDSIATPPRLAANNGVTSLDQVVINREMRAWLANDDIVDNQTDFTARFNTGKIRHSLVLGGSYAYEKNHRVLRTAVNSQTTLLDPNPNDIYTGSIVMNPLEPELTGDSLAGYVFDTVHFGEKVQLVGGLRWDRFGVEGRNVVTTGGISSFVPIDRNDTILSGRAAVVYKPVEAGSFYVSFGTSANPSFEGLLYSPASAELDPEKTRSYEAGTKWNLFHNRLLLTGALFRTDKTDARTTNSVDNTVSLDGDVRVQGGEFTATGNLTANWQVFAGYTFLDSEIVKSSVCTVVAGQCTVYTELGKELVNIPRNSFNLWTTYRWDRLFFGGGPRYVGKRYGNNTNTRFVDDYWVADLMASYRVSKNVDLRVNLNNITDKYYIDRIGGGHIVPGAGRVLLVSSSFRF
ncbi:MAG TPA: TonB-dependent siderophore receptor, partial [Pyrinomonadaceae bacterium]|nr:TonB-dependent siderophore receptor [Pyrinomonadaceae bacterium]